MSKQQLNAEIQRTMSDIARAKALSSEEVDLWVVLAALSHASYNIGYADAVAETPPQAA